MEPPEYACLMTRTGAPMMLESVNVEGDIKGLLFEASVEQRFCNPTDQSVEVVYTFPCPGAPSCWALKCNWAASA